MGLHGKYYMENITWKLMEAYFNTQILKLTDDSCKLVNISENIVKINTVLELYVLLSISCAKRQTATGGPPAWLIKLVKPAIAPTNPPILGDSFRGVDQKTTTICRT